MSFIDLKSQDKWKSCCKAAVDCCYQMLGFTESSDVANQNQNINLLDRQMYSAANETSSMSKYCPPTWDGWTCWPQTSPNQVALAQCPHFIYFETEPPACARNAEKVCTFDGTWYRRGETGASTEKTNYSPCSPVGTFKQRAHVHLYAYAVSVATLLPAIFIFYSYKQLNVYRIRLHKNMFISILLNSILVIVFKVFMILPQIATSGKKDSYINQNALVCRLMLITVKYLRLTNYAWMFCEGFYLHRLIAAAFAEQSSFSVFYVIGWVLPLFPTGIYAIIRSIWYDSRCWIEPIETLEWVLNTPCLFSLVVNLIFLVNIIRILVMKLRSTNTAEPSQYRKAVRATLVLVPLFGLHFVVTIYRPSKDGCDWMEFYHYANALLDGLQGFLVAIIFCYGNGEVHYLLKRSYRRFKEQRCLRTTRNNRRRRTERGQEEEEGGAEGIGCSVFLGRSNLSTTHFSLADCSPNPHQKPLMTTSGRSSVSDERHFLNEADSTVNVVRNILPEPSGHDNLLNSHLKEYNRQEMYKLNLKNPHVRETCLDNDN
ncbi:GPCR-like protein, family B [Daphnia pulex]|uniref:GPCR-like protein, family B n=1 Tax=Daphnia pulex TaxID=6669 RepID=E9HEC5_DAPPU|nr:GPCR-like protein, family B [Daphnia pulex]|eukprot:EFX69925.1 GPCR-like protein, family B [Daphnia pulex]